MGFNSGFKGLKSTCFEHYPAHLQEFYVVTVYICSLWYRHSVKSELSKITVLQFCCMTHHAQGDSIYMQFNHIRRIYLKFYHYQLSLISNAANYNRVILDNSLFTDSDDTRGCIYTITTLTS